MITVVGFSPAIDVTYTLNNLVPGSSHRVLSKTSKAGGKSVNVASVLNFLEVDHNLVLPLGGISGESIAQEMRDRGIMFTKLQVSKETRTCIAIVANEATLLNEPPTPLSNYEQDLFEQLIIDSCQDSKIIVFSGSIPTSLSPEHFGRLIESMRERSVKVFVDCSGQWLLAAARAKADFIKPNQDELAELFPSSTTEQAINSLLELGANAVYLSLGSDGGRYKDHQHSFVITVPKISGNATGAGDAFVAGFSKASEEELSLELSLVFASACASASVAQETAGEVERDLIEKLKSQVKVTSQ